MEHDVDALRAEVAELRAALADVRRAEASAITRRRLLTGLAGLGAAGAAGVASASPAGAADGDPLLLGEENEASAATRISTTIDGDTSEVVFGAPGPWAVFAQSDSTAILGMVPSGGVAGVNGEAVDTVGVLGNATGAHGIGVAALSSTGPALAAQSDGDGVTLFLVPADREGPPTSMPLGLSGYLAGCVSVDERGDTWVCVVGGAPGTWTRLLREDTAAGRTVPIPPLRAIDTRSPGGRPPGSPAVPGQTGGLRHGGTSVTLDLAGIGAIPATATGVVGNLTAVAPSYNGYLVARPSGPASTTSSLNFTNGVPALANAFTSQLGPDGLTISSSGGSANTHHLVVDITAYIT